MFPNNSQNHSDVPASLPPISSSGQSQQQTSQPAHAVPVQAGSNAATMAHYAAQTKQLVEQYSNDPYKLSEALSQLKSAYLTEQFHITSNQTGS